MAKPDSPDKQPTLFLRLFLSHLVLLAAAFAGAIFVFEYLFEPGIKYFLLHQPVIIIPIVLGLIGIAGILSAWMAGSIAEPIEEIGDALNSDDPARKVHLYRGPYGSEEMHRLAVALRRYQDRILSKSAKHRAAQSRADHTKTIVITASNAGVILSANLGAEVFTGKSRRELLYTRFTAHFASNEETAATIGRMIGENTRFDGYGAAAKDLAGNMRRIAWTSMPVYDTAGNRTGTMLFGLPQKK